MGITTQIIGLLASLSFLVLVHELGHYTFAKIFHTRVEKFYIFFNPGFSILRMKKFEGKCHFSFFSSNPPKEWADYPDNTEWGIGWIPLGGYCSIAGMIDETKSASDLASEPQPWEFRSKPAWQRLLIILGGVLVNFITALVVYGAVFYTWGEEYMPMENATYGMHFSEVAQEVGFQNHDKIISVDGKPMRTNGDFITSVLIDDVGKVQVERNGAIAEVEIPENFGQMVLAKNDNKTPICQFDFPFVIDSVLEDMPAAMAGFEKGDSLLSAGDSNYLTFFDFQDLFSKAQGDTLTICFMRHDSICQTNVVVSEDGKIGVAPKNPYEILETKVETYSLFPAVGKGISHGWHKLVDYVKQFKLVFTKEGATQLGGFGTIGSIFPKIWNWQLFWEMTAFLSLALAFMNFLPIPALDGGYILFILVEMITRRKPSDKFIGYANTIGFILLLLLLIWANGLDIFRAFN